MKRKIGVLLAAGVMGLAMPGMVLAAEGNGGQAAQQGQTAQQDQVVQQAEAMLQASLNQGTPVEQALGRVLKKYPEAAPFLVAIAVQFTSAQVAGTQADTTGAQADTTGTQAATADTAGTQTGTTAGVQTSGVDAAAIEKIVAVVRNTLGRQAEQVVAQGLLLAGVDPVPYLAATAAGNANTTTNNTAAADNNATANTTTTTTTTNQGNTGAVTGVGLPGGLPGGGTTGGGGGGGVSPS